MIRIRIERPVSAALNFQAGDEFTLKIMTPEAQALLSASGLDGQPLARLVSGDDDEGETATVSARGEMATTTGRGRRDQRAAAIS